MCREVIHHLVLRRSLERIYVRKKLHRGWHRRMWYFHRACAYVQLRRDLLLYMRLPALEKDHDTDRHSLVLHWLRVVLPGALLIQLMCNSSDRHRLDQETSAPNLHRDLSVVTADTDRMDRPLQDPHPNQVRAIAMYLTLRQCIHR
ncbi:unannotated protein [freshwater metagenome]|uniref:Unannotated protein n=1 Tax=freshwater metagenome TaxID=449393 RepID=A0A6J7IEC0_9ZZZZ